MTGNATFYRGSLLVTDSRCTVSSVAVTDLIPLYVPLHW